jgi:hypothetical protein
VTGTRADALLRSATFFVIAVVIHNADHVRRGPGSSARDVVVAGVASIVLELVIVFLVVQGHRLAPAAAAAGGVALAAGYLFVHLLPAHPFLSDSFFRPGISPFSWVAASLEVVAALTLAWAGMHAGRQRRYTATLPVAQAMRRPLLLVFAVSQVAILGVSALR